MTEINLVDVRERIALGVALDHHQRDWLLDMLRVPPGVSLEDWGSARAQESIGRAKAFHPLLAGLDPSVQGAILADLLATFILGHANEIRGDILESHLNVVIDLIKLGTQQ